MSSDGTRKTTSPGTPQRLTARREDREVGRRAKQLGRESSDARQQVLAVVEHEQERLRGDEFDHGVE